MSGQWVVKRVGTSIEYLATIRDLGQATGPGGPNDCHCPKCRAFLSVTKFFELRSVGHFDEDDYCWHNIPKGLSRSKVHDCGAILVATNYTK